MKVTIAIIIFISACQSMYSQSSIETILKDIEQNNSTLSALHKQTDALKMEGKTGIYMPDPEIELNYLWSNTPAEGNALELNVMQGFDFPTAYSYRSKIADGKALQADMQYLIRRSEILLQAHKYCIDVIYYNSVAEELAKRMRQAQSIADASRVQHENGDVSILEYNKAKLNLLSIKKEAESNAIARSEVLAELMRMNGGKSLELNDTKYSAYTLPTDFDVWYKSIEANNLGLKAIAQEIEISKYQKKLSSAMNLPKFSLGYKSERSPDITMQGIGSTISIPLWENKNAVKHADLQILAVQEIELDAKLQYRNSMKSLYLKAYSLEELIHDYQDILKSINNFELLEKALLSGHISLLEYITEQALYYDAAIQVLDAERDRQYAIAELLRWQ